MNEARLRDWAERADREQCAWAFGRPGPAIPEELWAELDEIFEDEAL